MKNSIYAFILLPVISVLIILIIVALLFFNQSNESNSESQVFAKIESNSLPTKPIHFNEPLQFSEIDNQLVYMSNSQEKKINSSSKEVKTIDDTIIITPDAEPPEQPINYISVSEEFLQTEPLAEFQLPEKVIVEWDTTVDLTNIPSSNSMVPKFLHFTWPTPCSHDNESREDDTWLIRHQEYDGHWDTGGHEGAGTYEMDCAATSAALMCLLNRGYSDHYGKYKKNVRLALEWVLSKQMENGSWSKNNYVNAICSLSLLVAVATECKSNMLKEKCESAINYILSQQNKSGGFDYTGPSYSDNMIVTGWCVMVLYNATFSNIKAEESKVAIQRCNELLDTTEGTSDNSVKSKGLAWYLPGVRGTGNPGGGCQAVAMFIRLCGGWSKTEPWMVAATTGQIINLPKDFQSLDIHSLFFLSYLFFKQGGQNRVVWSEHIYKITSDAMRKDENFNGTWDNNGSSTDWGGRVLNTSLIWIFYEDYFRLQSVMVIK